MRTDPRAALAEVTDPEIPVLTIEDLGVLRDVVVEGERVVVTVTPTYSGCPAMDEIRADVRAALQRAGWDDVEVRTVLSP
ncbi:MAG TPA: iron-sulfur cluster assembly protein, partial [Mycobacteriales bacterium]|nr:iron-sulfur cluster assembly protein [Mycobacteriales bacterium]